jgi:hypothetical protein
MCYAKSVAQSQRLKIVFARFNSVWRSVCWGEQMAEPPPIPREGVDLRKCAALVLALGLARGALSEALAGNFDDAQRIMDVTTTSRIAAALGWTESELAIDWSEHLTPGEADRIKGWYPRAD